MSSRVVIMCTCNPSGAGPKSIGGASARIAQTWAGSDAAADPRLEARVQRNDYGFSSGPLCRAANRFSQFRSPQPTIGWREARHHRPKAYTAKPGRELRHRNAIDGVFRHYDDRL